MPPVPLDEGNPWRRRVGPFWIEEGPASVVAGGLILAVFVLLFVIAFLLRPT